MAFGCETWELDLDACCSLPDGDWTEEIARWSPVSTQILWADSGKRFGVCERTIRPCLRRCLDGYGGSVWGSPFFPYRGFDGEWRNISSCACLGDCSCGELCEIPLEGPVADVTGVYIDGAEVDAGTYRLDRRGSEYVLLRTNGECWPSCQDIQANCDEVGAFCVTYLQGIEVPELGIAAHSELTCELVKSCIPGCECKLPVNVSSVTKRGVSLKLEPTNRWWRNLPKVAAFIQSVNPNNLTGSPRIWSPDIPQVRRTVEPEVS